MKRFIPNSISVRFTLITFLPILLVQIISLYFFINRHFTAISRNMAASVISQIQQVIYKIENNNINPEDLTENYSFSVEKIDELPRHLHTNNIAAKTLRHFIKHNLNYKYHIAFSEPNIQLYVHTHNGIFLFSIPKSAIFSSTTIVFMFLILFIPLILFVIAHLFLRNQLKPIIRLSNLMQSIDQFNEEPQILEPSGSKEIKTLIVSFNNMVLQLHRFLSERTIMLAGVSHDIRTYLTRLKLQTMMLDNNASSKLLPDILSMETMLAQFLELSKNQYISHNKQKISLEKFIQDIINQVKKSYSLKIETHVEEETILSIDIKNLTRCFLNIIDNASRYATECCITAYTVDRKVVFCIEDNGPGLPKDEMQHVLTPFYKTDSSRKIQNNGSGLGLSIVKNILDKIDGTIKLEKSDNLNGLKIVITVNNIK